MWGLTASACLLAWFVASPTDLDDELRKERNWAAGAIADQLDSDPTLLPFGKGGIFVPAMSNPLDEPPVSVWREGHKVAEGTTGHRIPVLPGTYEVRMGSGAVDQRFSVQTSVRELHSSVVPVAWAGLVIHVVDEEMNSLRGSYELIGVEDRQYFGIGFGTDEQAGEPVSTWILKPGLYKIVRVGETYRARRDFSTVRLMPGRLTHFQLVQDAETGEYRGGGEIPIEELFQFQRGGFWVTLILGGDLSINSRENVLGSADGQSYAVRLFLDTKLSAEIFESPFILRLQIEEGQTKAPDLPLQKNQDRADLDGLYVYKLEPWIGPYLRFGVETNLVNGFEFFEEPVNVTVLNGDGTPRRRRSGIDHLRLSSPLALTKIKEGAGLNVRVFKNVFGEATVRAGVGARHSLTRGLLEPVSGTDFSGRVYQRKGSSNQVGVEGTLVAVARITRWVLLNAEVDTLMPFDDLSNVILELEGTVAVKLTRFVSVNYVLRYLRDPTLSDVHPLEHDVLLRFSVEIF